MRAWQERGYAGICEDCPFAPLFPLWPDRCARGRGCGLRHTRATREPFASVDVVYGLGSSVAVASGFRKKGIAVVGDYALAHSGLQGLINALWQKRDVLAVVLKNDMAAMTGGQEAPDLTPVLEKLLPTRYLQLPAPAEDVEAVLREELKRPGPSAVVALGKCTKRHGSK